MKKILLIILSLSANFSFSQVNITNSTYPADGTNKTYYEFDTTGLNLASTGANHSWTFTAAGTVNTGTYLKYSYMSPASTPYSTFMPTADKAIKKITKNALYNDSIYSFFSSNNDSLTVLGYKEVGLNRSHVFSNPEKLITYPFAYSNSLNDSYKKLINSAVNSTGNMTVSADGYGTLTLGTQTYLNVNRLKIVETDVRPLSGYTEYYTTTQYIWCNNSFVDPLMIVEYVTIKVQTSMTTSTQKRNNAYVKSDATTGIKDIAKNNIDFTIYPSPANNFITIDVNIFNIEKGVLQIFNNLGESVLNTELKQLNQINIESLPTGIYTVTVITKEGRSNKKFVKAN